MDAVAACDQNAKCGVEVFPFIGAVEGICEQQDFATVNRAHRVSIGFEHIASPFRQLALCTDAGEFFEQPSQQRAVVAPVGEWGEVRSQAGIVGQVAHQPIPERKSVAGDPGSENFDLHLGHVDAGGAFVAAGLAGDAELQGVHHLVGGERIRAQLAGDRQPQGVGPSARDILLIARDAIGRTHHAAFELAAGAIVVAHLDRALETAARAGIGRPIELRR